MIDIKYLREHKDEVRDNCVARRSDADIDEVLMIDEKYTKLLQETEGIRAERNENAKKAKQGKPDPSLIEEGKKLKSLLAEKDEALKILEKERETMIRAIPNLTHPEAPKGESDEDNAVLREVGKINKISDAKDHTELAKIHDLIDFERGAKVSGAKHYFLKNKLAVLEQALIRYGIDFAIKEGFEFLATPDLAREEILMGKGFLPRGPEKQVYYIEGEDLALIGTAEITVLGYHMNEVLKKDEVPKKYVAFSHCFRTESGAYGRESYGLYRVHQFAKVEMFAFAAPEQSEALHLEFLAHEEKFWQSLGIPYRVVDCVTGDLGGSDYRRYDIEAWMWGKNDGQGGYGEVTSCSNCWDYQSRGLQIKYEDENGDKKFVHTLNGTVVATPRALLAILENFQQEDGSIKIPEVLVPYCGFEKIG
ncbi:MAG: serine--tRNA ligase [Patescibacteria group bacterium]